MKQGQDELPVSFLTEDEMSAFINRKPVVVEDPPERRAAERHEFACFRSAADLQTESASPGGFYQVHCRDISTRGIGFFSPRRPASDCVVIRLSGDGENPLLIAGKVVYCSEKSGDPSFPFVVGCMFTQRL